MKINNPLILFLFFLTGATGLVYELVWTRILILTFGSTHFAITTVLTTFMTGLAIGSILFGKIADRYKHPIVLYALIELGIGIYCFLTPYIFAAIKYVYLDILPSAQGGASFNPYQFFLSFLGIILPATLMGGTLPAVLKYFSSSSKSQLKKRVNSETFNIGLNSGILYAINTFGAVTGTLATGTYLLYQFGIKHSLYLAGTIDLLAAAAILLGVYFSKTPSGAMESPVEEVPTAPSSKETDPLIVKLTLAGFLISGFASLAYEVLWAKVLTLILGSSIYAFTIILTAFLAGISIGSILFSNFRKKFISPIALFAVLQALIGLSAICSIFLYTKLPYIFGKLHLAFSQNFWLFLFLQFVICLSIMIVPTICMGATFPVVSDIYSKGVKSIGSRIGKIYFFNTLGSIFGSFTAGFILVPSLGIQTSIWVIAILNITIFLVLSLMQKGAGRWGKLLLPVVSIALPAFLIFSLPRWDKNIMTLGPYVTPVYQEEGLSGRTKDLFESELLMYREGLNAVISVRKKGNRLLYQANGKVEAKMVDNKPSAAWYILGHIPMMLVPDSERALLIGLGSGVTLGAMAEYPLKEIDVVELEPAVVEAASYFAPAHNHALDDPRVNLNITDGRGFISTTKKNYDVIISGVSDPWISGVSNLFTIEYFMDLKSRLAETGIAAIWFQNYKTSDEDFKTGINTFAEVFPYTSVWFHYSLTADLIVIGSKTPHNFNLEGMERKFLIPEVKTGLSRIGVSSPYDLFEFFLIGNDDLRTFISGAGINTDNLPVLEFSLPKAQYTHSYGSAERVEQIIGMVKKIVPPVSLPKSAKAKEAFYMELGKVYSRDSFRDNQTQEISKTILQLNPENQFAKTYLEQFSKK